MRVHATRVASLMLCALWASAASAQSSLERLERRFADPQAAEQALADDENDDQDENEAEGEPGYLGAVLDGRQTVGRGVEVVEVVPGGPADEAGLERGDLVQSVNEQRVREMSDLVEALQPLGPGTEVTLGVVREGEEQGLSVTLGQRPPRAARRLPDLGDVPPAPRPRRVQLGIAVRPVDEETAQRLELEEPSGVLVAQIVVGSPADRAGLPLESVIVAVNGEPVRAPDDLAALLDEAQPGDELTVDYLSRGRPSQAVIVLEAAPPPQRGPEEFGDGGADEAPAAQQRDELAERVEVLEQLVRELAERVQQLERELEAREERP